MSLASTFRTFAYVNDVIQSTNKRKAERATVILTILAASALVFPGSSSAEELRPAEAQAIHLKDVTGTAYYTARPEGYQLVATLAASDTTTPIRFVGSLNPGQTVTISVPGEIGAPSSKIDFTRVGDQVIVATPKGLALAN